MTVVEIAAMMRVSRATAYASCTPATCPRSAATARVNPAAGCPEVVPVAEPPLPLTFEALSTPELCLAWWRSYLALLDVTSYPARCNIVGMRECLLDELERRERDGFTRWLDTGARAGSDPGRYLSTDR
jgi:hypothetical protein